MAPLDPMHHHPHSSLLDLSTRRPRCRPPLRLHPGRSQTPRLPLRHVLLRLLRPTLLQRRPALLLPRDPPRRDPMAPHELYPADQEVLTGTHMDLRPISGQFHDLHCTYEWLRLIRALAEGRPLDRKLSKFEHSHHCSGKLLEKDKTGRNETRDQTANLLFGRCGLTAEKMYAYGTKE